MIAQQTHHTTERLAELLVRLIYLSSFLISGLILVTWVVNPIWINTILPESATTKFNTALLFFIITLFLFIRHQNWLDQFSKVNLLPIVVILVAGFTLISYLLELNSTFLDELFVSDPLTALDAFPGRMSQMTAFLFVIFGITLLCIRRNPRLAEYLAIGINLIAIVALLGFLFDFQSLYNITFFDTVSFFTALLFSILSIATFLSIPEGLIRNLWLVDEPVSITLRWLLPLAIIIPVSFSWGILQGMNHNFYQPAFALVLQMGLSATVQTMVIVSYARTLQHWYHKEKKMQNQLLNTTIEHMELENMQEMNKLREEFFAQLSHDMRTPISSIILSTDILTKYQDTQLTQNQERHLRRIRHHAVGILDFVDDMMFLSRFELNEMPYEPQLDDLSQFCQIFHEEFLEFNDLNQNTFILDVPEKPLMANFDRKLVKRMLNNLMSNATKYSPNGGEIRLQIQKYEQQITLRLSDKGVGIPEDDIDSLFRLFSRASNVENIRGYGLGLTIVKQIVELHSATISVQSKLGEGSTFSIAFPTTD